MEEKTKLKRVSPPPSPDKTKKKDRKKENQQVRKNFDYLQQQHRVERNSKEMMKSNEK